LRWDGSVIGGDEISLKGCEEKYFALQVPLNSGKKNVNYVNCNDSNLTIQTIDYENIQKNIKGIGHLEDIGDLPANLIIKSIKRQFTKIKNLEKNQSFTENKINNNKSEESNKKECDKEITIDSLENKTHNVVFNQNYEQNLEATPPKDY